MTLRGPDYSDTVLSDSSLTEMGWIHSCGVFLLAAEVHHSFYDGPFPLTGYGNVMVQKVPYCPQCHEKPSAVGAPITPEMTKWPVVPLRLSDRKNQPCPIKGSHDCDHSVHTDEKNDP